MIVGNIIASNRVALRDVQSDDIPIFFEHQNDAVARYMVAFTAEKPYDETSYQAQWDKIGHDDTVITQTILYDGEVAGNVLYFDQFGKPSVGYWIGKAYWGKGIATEALRQFVNQLTERPLYARAAKDNAGSIRVLEKCGFVKIGEDKGFAHARHAEIDEVILRLD